MAGYISPVEYEIVLASTQLRLWTTIVAKVKQQNQVNLVDHQFFLTLYFSLTHPTHLRQLDTYHSLIVLFKICDTT